MRTVIFSNQKGGVGKTTVCRNLAWHLSCSGRHVLMIDLDAQGNLTKSFLDEETLREGSYDTLMTGSFPVREVKENLSILTGDGRLSLLEKQLVGEIDGYTRLFDVLEKQDLSGFDHIFIDSPPSLGMLTANGMCAADGLVVPMTAGLFSLQGTNDLLATVRKVKKTFNERLEVLGFVINGYDGVPVINREIREEILEVFGRRVFRSFLPKSVKVEEAVAGQTGVTSFSGRGTEKVKSSLVAFAEEFLSRTGMLVS